jgi:7,8-dihydropterin-6-yl-methyl-4-(beta-D-ribofuranosyl)aminobenzene 5'-phosphate synthase
LTDFLFIYNILITIKTRLSRGEVFLQARITVLSENSVIKPGALIGEHGFSALVERGDEKILFDTGQGYALIHNARILGVDLGLVKKVVLSHGHNDHTGGLSEFLKDGGMRDIYAHPGIFNSRYREVTDGSPKPIGIPFTRSHLEGLGARFHLSEEPQEVAEGIKTTGMVPRRTSFETGDTTLVLGKEHGGGRDPLSDDLSLVVEGDSGLVVLLGCAHSGLVNILNHVRDMAPGQSIKAVVGGTHLGLCSEEQMGATIEAVTGMGVEKVGASHCTGLVGSSRLMAALGDRFFFAGVGAFLEV